MATYVSTYSPSHLHAENWSQNADEGEEIRHFQRMPPLCVHDVRYAPRKVGICMMIFFRFARALAAFH